MSRRALDYVCPLPFALIWFLCVITFRDTRQLRYMAIGGVALGIGLYSYIAAWALMPFLLLLTPLAVSDTGSVRRTATLTAIAGFIAPLLPLVPWLTWHPETLQTLARYQLPAGQPTPSWDLVTALTQFDLAQRVSLYWDYFSPSFLFFAGGVNLPDAGIGIFPLAMAVFLAAGIYHLARRRSRGDTLLMAVVLFAPVPIAITLPDTPAHTIARAQIALPFAALIAAHGIERLMMLRHPAARTLALLLVCAVPLQSGLFIADYFTGYQIRTARLSDPFNTAAVAAYLVAEDARESIPAIYLPSNAKNSGWLWKFWTLKIDRPDLWTRTREFDPGRVDAGAIPSGSLVVAFDHDVAANPMLSQGGYSVATVIRGLDGDHAVTVLRKMP